MSQDVPGEDRGIPAPRGPEEVAPDDAGALSRVLAVEPSARSLRRLLGALVEAIPSADAAALVTFGGGRAEVAAAIGLDADEAPELGGALAADAEAGRAAPGPPLPEGTRAACAARAAAGETRATLVLGSRTADAFAPAERLLVRVAAERAALALEAARLEAERDAARAAAAEAAAAVESRRAAIDQILGIVGHDLRNPLGAIHMSAVLLQKKGGLAGWQARTVERVRSSAGRMGRIIADLLSYTRTRLGSGIPIARRAASLADVVGRAVDELRAANPDRAIEVAVDGDPTGEWDPDRLEQVVSNLVSNAVDHGEPGVPVRVHLLGDGDAVTLEVVNRGEFPPPVLAHLFEPFAQASDEQQRKGSGLGLGLYIAREIVRGHGGDIAVRSGGETAISVRLPRRAPA